MEAQCRVYMLIDENKLKVSGTADFVSCCIDKFMAATTEPRISGSVFVTVDIAEPGAKEEAPATYGKDEIGDAIAFFTDEDFEKDDNNLACTAIFRTAGYGDEECDVWSVRIADAGSPTAHPVIDECTTGTDYKYFDTRDEVISYMAEFGFKPV